MKKNIITIVLIVTFDLLFYKQIPGINIGIFSLLLIAICFHQKPKLKFDKTWLLLVATTMLSAIFVGIYGDFLSTLACFISFSLFAAHTAERKSSIWIALSGCAYSYLRSPFILFNSFQIQLRKWQNKKKNENFIKAGIIGITFLIVLVFFFIYRNSSLLFYNLTQKINLDFLSFSLILFTLNALLLITAFQKYKPIEKLYSILDKPEKYIENDQTKTEEETNKISIEQFAGILLFSSLNILLIIVNLLDIGFLINRQLPQGISYSAFIHQGVGMLILSILLAISLILYFFRKELNFSNNKWLKIFAYIWVVQNIFMVLSNISRNTMYIDAYGLTEKRIGVYFYLLLAAIGLVITIIKIYKKQSNAYLIRFTTTVFFVILLVSNTINWDNLITRHDLARNDADTNFDYLNSLSNTNIPQMLDYVEKNKWTKNDKTTQEQLKSLHNRILNYLNNYNENNDWRSFSYYRYKVVNEINSKKINKIYLQYLNDYQIKAIRYLPNVTEIIAQNTFTNTNQWEMLPHVKRLTLINCGMTNLKQVQNLNQLEYLDITCNTIADFSPLYRLKNLKELHVSDIGTQNLKKLHIMLPQTHIYLYHQKDK